MRQILGALLLVALATTSVHAACSGKTSAESYVGEVSLLDNVVEFNGGWVRIPEIELGSSYHSFEMDVFSSGESGCLFSFGAGPNLVEARIEAREIKFRVGATEATSLAVFDLGIWQHLSIHFNNSAEGNVEIFVDNLRVVPDSSAAGVVSVAGLMQLANRAGFLGKCSSNTPVTAIDNFFITDNYRTVDDIEATMRQFFPVLPENSLVAYLAFNEEQGQAKSLNGQSSFNWLEGTLGAGAARKARSAFDKTGLMNTDSVCTHNGANVVVQAGSDNSFQTAPYNGIAGGGFTNTLDCSFDDVHSFAVNQRWDDNGAVIGVSIYSHIQHRWRVTPGPALKVERADWGGWLQIAESVGILEEDGSTYIIGKDVFQLQVANVGWVRIALASPTSLSYQYALNKKGCATADTRDTCSFKTTDREMYHFSHIAMIEPMGLESTTAGVGNLPATLACPTPSFNGYPYHNPVSYCNHYGYKQEPRCCDLAGVYYSWCQPKQEQCWTRPLGSIRSSSNQGNAADKAYCCAHFKYENGNTAGNRLPWCDITYNDCHTGPFDSRCCSEALRINRATLTTLDQCQVTNYDCWTVGVDDSGCCSWSWPATDAQGEGSGLRYRSGNRHRSCPLSYNDCHRRPGSLAEDPKCCSQYKYNNNKYRLEYCEPTHSDCWMWFTDKTYPMQEDGKCCAKPTQPGQVDKRFWTNSAGQVIALPFCDIDNKDCWTTGVIDARCCSSDDRKYFLNADGTTDFTRKLEQCSPNVDDCWGWDTNPVKYPRKVEDQRCCQNRATRYHPVTGKRLDYCYPNFDDCWGYHLAGNLRDDDARCCESFPEAKDERLPYCLPSQPVPPPPPVAPPPPPVLSVDVCLSLKENDQVKYDSIVETCENIWGTASTQNVARLTCIATMCKNDDPETPPVPDCRVERLLNAANPEHPIPPACTEGCPNGCYGRGSCSSRVCSCKSEWTGADCSIPTNYNKCEFSMLWDPSLTFAQCQPFLITYQNQGITPMLTRDFDNITVQYYDFTKRIRDTTTIHMIKTIDDFTSRKEQFHLVISNNDGTGQVAGEYTMTLKFAGSPDLSNAKFVHIGSGVSGTIDNSAAKTIQVRAKWTKTTSNAFVIFNITRGAAPDFTIKMDGPQNQVLMACQSNTGDVEVNRLTTAQYTTEGALAVRCAPLNTACSATDCKSCAALANCGWCVETGSCQPGAPNGPFVGQCFNWRFTFDSTVNRRLTIIPGFPTNPRLTDVYLRQSAGGNELPIEIGITSFDSASIPWDLVMFNEYTAATQPAFYPQGITRILAALTEFPNAGIAIANLRTDDQGFNFVKLVTNPRDFGGIPASLQALDSGLMTPTTGSVDVMAAMYRAADPQANVFNLRSAARSVFLVTSTRPFQDRTGDAVFMTQLRQRLLDRNAAVVFAVPQNLVASYQSLLNKIGFGRVVVAAQDLSNIHSIVPTALVRAASSIGLSVGADRGHIASTQFDARKETYTIDNVRPPMRAKFWVPVVKTATTSRFTQLYFPTYGRSTIETVPTDAPLGLTPVSFFGKSDEAQLIELKGRSFRNLFKVSFNLTVLPTSGRLFIAKMDATGEWVKTSDELPHSGELLSSDLPFTLPFDRVIYQANDPAVSVSDSFKYIVIDGCTESGAYQVGLQLVAGPTPPVAEMPGPRGGEGEPMLVTLGYSNPDAATVQVFLTRDLYDATEGADRTTFPIGKFCRYIPETFGTPSFDRNCAPITASTVVPIEGNKLVYVPPFYGHSFADPTIRPELLIIPCFGYHVGYTFTTEAITGVSNELDVQIILDHVNQAPFAWGDPQDELRDNIFKYNWATAEAALRGNDADSDMVCIPAVGGATCTYEEDFGERYWWNTGDRYISLGGYDVEASDLTIEIVSLDLPAGATLMAWYDDSKNVEVGDIIPNMKSGTLNNVIRFRPEKEMHSRPTDADAYASFSYRVIDSEGARSAKPAVVKIVVLPVDKPPRMSRQVLDVTVYEGRPMAFPIDAEDPEGQAFDSYLVGCTSKKGQLYICLDATKRCDPINNPTNAVSVSCENIPATGVKLPRTAGSSAGVEFIGLYVAPKLASVSEGLKFETVFFEFRDGSVDRFAPFKFVVNFNVIKINQAPEIYVADASGMETAEPKYSASLPMGNAWSSKIRVEDSDIGFGLLAMNISLDSTYAGSAKFDLAALGAGGSIHGIRVQQPRRIQFVGSLASANQLLARLSANLDLALIPDSGYATATVVISVSDNGYTGQCPDSTQFSVRTCAQTDEVEITINWAKSSDNNQVTVAASASAAAFAGVAAVAAALLFRKLNSKAENGYAPWTVDEGDDGIVSNPLYESNGTERENPLFEQGDL